MILFAFKPQIYKLFKIFAIPELFYPETAA